MIPKTLIRQKIQALQLARERIDSCKEPWLCRALAQVATLHSELDEAVTELRRYIMRVLGKKHGWLDSWLRRYQPTIPRSEEYMRLHRLQWIDWMIGCLQEDLNQ